MTMFETIVATAASLVIAAAIIGGARAAYKNRAAAHAWLRLFCFYQRPLGKSRCAVCGKRILFLWNRTESKTLGVIHSKCGYTGRREGVGK